MGWEGILREERPCTPCRNTSPSPKTRRCSGVIFLSLSRKIVQLLDCRAKNRKTRMTSVAILLILLPTGLALGYHRYMGARATRRVSIEVACLSLDQIVDIGTKSSTSMVKRAVRRPQPYAAQDGAVEWRTQSKGGVMLYRVLPSPRLPGFPGRELGNHGDHRPDAGVAGSAAQAPPHTGGDRPRGPARPPARFRHAGNSRNSKSVRLSGLPLVQPAGNCLRWRHESAVWSAW